MFDPKTPVLEIMSRDLVVLRADAKIREALATLRDYALPGAPVVDARGECVGVFSLTDAARYVVDSEDDDDTVADWMTPGGKWVPLDATAGDVARIMADEEIHRVLVMDGRALRGIVTALDLVRLVVKPERKKPRAKSAKARH